MGKKLKRFFALLLATCLTMSTVNISSAEEGGQTTPLAPGEGKFVKSKTATDWIDDVYADVTLNVGGEQTDLGVDIVYIVGSYASNSDGTPNVKGDVLISSLVDTIKDIVEMGTSVNFGMVPFSSDSVIAMDLTAITKENLAALPDMIANALATCEAVYDGVNMENALVKCKKMFNESPLVNHPERQHLVMITSGFTYFFNSGENNENAATVPVNYTGVNRLFYWNKAWQRARTNQTNTYPIPKGIVEAYNAKTDKAEGETLWDFYWSYIDQWSRADIAAGDKVVYEACTIESGNFIKWYNSGELVTGYSQTGYGKAVPKANTTEEDIANAVTLTAGQNPLAKNSDGEYTAGAKAAQHAIGYERSMWESYEYCKANITGAGINFYPIYNALQPQYTNGIWADGRVNDNGLVFGYDIGYTNQYIGHSFVDMLAGGEGKAIKYEKQGDKAFFDPIRRSILYSLSDGTSVVDYIGYNNDPKNGDNYDFDFVDVDKDGEAAWPKLKIGNVDYTTAKIEKENGDATYTFTAPNKEEATFTLDYHRGNGKEEEHFVWTFYENISKYAPASLTYKVKLMNKSEMPGTYTVFTNQYAVLNPVDSDGNTSQPELFERPELQYVVEGVNISAKKVWDDDKDRDGIRPDGVEIRLFIENQEALELGEDENIDTINNADIVEQVTLNAGNNWKYNWSNLRKFLRGKEIIYVVEEVNVPDDYEYQSNYVPGEAVVTDFVLTNTHELEKTKVSVKKEWVDANNQDGIRPEYVKVQLKANGKPQGDPVVLSGDEWQYTWENLLKNEAGKAIEYTVEEVDVSAGYTPTVTGDAENGYTITNTHTPAVINIAVTKEWDDKDNVDNIRPTEVTVQLYEVYEGKETAIGAPVTLNVANNWSYEWTELTKYRVGKVGELVVYEVKEVGTHEFYNENDNEPKIEKKVTETTNSFTITNTHKPFETEVKVTKEWNDKDNQDGIRPADIQVQLYADGAAKGNAVTLNADNNWTHTWTELSVNKKGENGENGIAIEYTVDELGTDKLEKIGYTKEKITGDAEKGYTITNTHTPAETQVTVTKEWSDKDNQDGIRSTEIIVQLYADENAEGEAVTLNAANNWTYTWTELPVNAAGEKIAYTVKETKVTDGYTPTTKVTGDAATGYTVTITNTHTPAVITVDVTKEWKDGENVDNIRPTEVTVQLYADDVAQGEPVTLNAANNWTHEWKDLTKYRVGKVGELVEYEVKEVNVPENYKDTTDKAVTETTNSFTITNTHKPFETEVKVTKVWEDDNNRDNVRPNEIRVQLYADGAAKGEAVILNKDNNWTYTWTELSVNKKGENGENGIAIEYTVDELETEELAKIGYTKKELIEGDAATGFTITNTRKIDTTKVSVQKKWDDNKDKFNLRPDSIQVQLYKYNDKDQMVPVQDAVTLDATNGWYHEWKELPKNEEGKEGVAIRYTVKEVQTPEFYESTLSGTAKDGFTITNKLLRTTLTLTKRIDQADSQTAETATAIFRYLITGPENYRANVTINFESGTVKVDGVVQSTDDDLRDNIGFDKKGLTVTLENLQSGDYTIIEYAARGYQLVQMADEDKDAPKASATAINGVQNKLKVTTTVDNPAEVYYWNRYKAPNDYTAVNRFSVDANGNLGISIKRQ